MLQPSSCNSSCPNNSVRCDTLGNYTDLLVHSNVENWNLSLIFLCGRHTLQNSPTDTINVSRLHYLSVQGDGNDPSLVVIEGIKLVIQSVEVFCLLITQLLAMKHDL